MSGLVNLLCSLVHIIVSSMIVSLFTCNINTYALTMSFITLLYIT